MLKVENLCSDAGLKNISFELPAGYICGLIGENGAGKTTLINSIIGVEHITEGKIYIDGKDLFLEPRYCRQRLAFILDKHKFDKYASCIEVGKFYGDMYDSFDINVFSSYLEKFNLNPKEKVKNLSKGMSIKLQLAFALSYDAKLYVFDEPTAGLDSDFTGEFVRICTELVSDGTRSVLISSNITEDLDRIADYAAYMKDMKLCFFTTKEELIDRYLLVTGEDYKINLIPKEYIIYKEKGAYSSTAMVVDTRMISIDESLSKRKPSIREFMHYFVKGGRSTL